MPVAVVGAAGPHVLFVNTRDSLGADVAVHQLLARTLAAGGGRVAFTINRLAPQRAALAAPLAGRAGIRLLECPLGRPLADSGGRWGRARGGLANLPGALGVAELAAYIRRHRVDVLHATDRPRDALLCVLLGRLTGRTSVIHMHSNDHPGLSRATRWALERCTVVVAVSAFLSGCLRASGLPSRRLAVVHNAVDAAHFRPDAAARGVVRARWGIPPDATLIGLIGRLIPYKGHLDLIEALALAGDALAGAHLVIAGAVDDRSPYVTGLRQAISRLGLQGRVHFIGHQADVRAVYADLEVLAVPSWDEPFGLVVTEAMAMQVPVVAYRAGGIPEIVRSGCDGLLVARRNTAELSRALAAVLADPSGRARMGAAGRQRVLACFSPERQAGEILSVYRQAMGQRRSVPGWGACTSSIRPHSPGAPMSATSPAGSASRAD